MRSFLFGLLLLLIPSSSLASQSQVGLLVMAHGGNDNWNEAVREAVRPLAEKYPVAIAFGMTNPETLRSAVNDLKKKGMSSIAVVRLFVSATSFLPETEYAFGLRTEKPSGQFMNEPEILGVEIPVILNSMGLLDASALGAVLADRSVALSTDPGRETVLIIGHGPASDDENRKWLRKMNSLADSVRALTPFHSVLVRTLREDWTGKRKLAELELRDLIKTEAAHGRTVLVIPFRLYGFGPYSEVFEGLDYRSDGMAFLPDDRVTCWIENQYLSLSETLRSGSANPAE